MKTMNWNRLKNKLYVWDGGWLDIYVHSTSCNDWKIWSDYVNQNFKINWYNGKAERDEIKIMNSLPKKTFLMAGKRKLL
jgi:hypothetical protein